MQSKLLPPQNRLQLKMRDSMASVVFYGHEKKMKNETKMKLSEGEFEERYRKKIVSN